MAVELLEPRALLDAAGLLENPVDPIGPVTALTDVPDLVIGDVDIGGLAFDGQSLTVDGVVTASVTNRGGDVTTPWDVVFFEDFNGNAAYDVLVDQALGGVSITDPLPAGASVPIAAELSGPVRFAGNFVWAMVDSGRTIAEADESNNVARPASRTIPQSSEFDPVIEWHKGEFSVRPDSNQVMMLPAVVDLDRDDIPDIVFSTFSGENYHTDGILRAVSGVDGTDLWNVTDPEGEVAARAGVAVGDIDGDGLPEIIAQHESAVLIAFEHDGALKWKSPPLWGELIWGSAAIADLEGDGIPEIIIGGTVLNNDGTIRWQGNAAGGLGRGDNVYGPLSAVADLDSDGSPEIVAGKSAYRADGALYWNAEIEDGFPGVANFDDDAFPEVVVVSAGNIHLLEHTGQIKWGPVAIPGGGSGGAPVVADVDGDGEPEIGVAGRDAYTVFETDGSIKWSRATQDHSSDKSGSSAFDFDGDGKAEIVYSDELFLRIYRGDDGDVLYQLAKGTATTYEYPLIVDVDADGNAEIVAVANDYRFGNENGLYVIGDAADTWVSARQIWNQHTYHVTNVNDDGRIPAFEVNSWELHNTYRANVLLDRSPLDAPDLTASYLRADGDERDVTITARIGNGGALFVPAGIPVAFYDGDPDEGGTLLGQTVTTVRLEPGRYQDVSIVVPRSGVEAIRVVADYDGTGKGQVREPDEANNVHFYAFLPDLTIGDMDNSGLVYDRQALTVSGTITARVTNRGGDVAAPWDVLFFEDLNGNSAYDAAVDNTLGGVSVQAPLSGGGSVAVSAEISGQVQFAGNIIWAMVDSGGAIAEANEGNNLARPASRNIPLLGAFDPVVEWQKSEFSARPESNLVMMTPAVVDVNDDGIPDIVFSTYAGFAEGSHRSLGAGEVLRAVSGSDGADLWNVTDPQYQVEGFSGVAAGDIDVDGRPEIIATHDSGVLIAFEHDGTFKWKSPPVWGGVDWGSAAIADLDIDGVPEIVVGSTVLNNDGTIRWEGHTVGGLGIGGNKNHPLSCVADLDLDGSPEVVSGRSAFHADGSLYWNALISDGFPAIANFDSDPFPEVVIVGNGYAWLLEHTGDVRWGPVTLPGAGHGGAPAIADMDGDGEVEIGVGTAACYAVLDTDGSVLWQNEIQDGSRISSSSAFDFDGDGSAEVVYGDENYLRIYRGADGHLLYEFPKGSSTTCEYPVIADVDADGNAEIVAVASRGGQNGLYIIGDAADTWVSTRQIWNQHTYHVTNVNEDGTIPALEANSWEVHNTYRASFLLNRSPLDAPDLTASYLRADGGAGEVTLTARIGNGGALFVPAGIPVAFYDGDPSEGAVLLGQTVTTVRLEPGDYQDVSIVVPRSNLGEVWVIADDDGTGKGQVREPNEAYNAHHTYVFREESLGTVDFLAMPSLDPSTGALWYSLSAARDAILTIESLDADSEIVLYDADGNELRVSEPVAGGQRIDWPVHQGQTFLVRVRGASDALELRIANLLRHDGETVMIYGTAASDGFVFEASAPLRRVEINGVGYAFAPQEATVFAFDGFEGSDSVRVSGAGGPDTATLRPTSGVFLGEDYRLDATDVEAIDYAGGAGDTVTIWGSKGANTYAAGPGIGEMTGDGVSTLATAETIYARGNGGGDTVVFEDSDGDDVLEYFSTWARMRGEGYFHHVRGFSTMRANAELGQNGTDKVVVRGSGLNDYLKVNPYNADGQTVARFLSGSGSIWHIAFGFDTIVGYGRGGALIDQLFLNDTPGADTFELERLHASLDATDYGVTVTTHGFGTVEARRAFENENADRVDLYDAPHLDHNDTLVGNPEQVTMTGPGYSNNVYNFPLVMAYSNGKGYDTAHFSDLADPNDSRIGVDTFTGRPIFSTLEGSGYRLYARLFDEVHAESKYGLDIANLHGNANGAELTGTATDVRLSGTHSSGSYANHARSFHEVNAFGTSDADKAVLTDATVDLNTYGPPADVPLDELAQLLWLDSFEKIERWDSGTGSKADDIDNIDRVFAWWE